MKSRNLVLFATVISALLLLTLVLSATETTLASIEPPAGADSPPITLNISQPSYPELDPALASDVNSINVVEQLFAGLFDVDDETSEPKPELVDSWDISPDRTVYTFTLRSDATWSGGSPVTAADVRYGILRSLDPATGAPFAYTLYIIDNAQDYHEGNIVDPNLVGVDALDPSTLRIALREPASYLPTILSGCAAYPMPQWAIEAHGWPTWTAPANIVTSGAYNFAESLPDDVLVLEKNNDYFAAESTQIEQVNLWLRNANYAWQMYLDGKLDTATVPDDVEIDPAMDAEIDWHSRAGTDYLGFSISQEPFDDPLVRRAFSAAIDRVALGNAYYGTTRKPALTFTPPDVFGHVDGYAEGIGLPYNPSQAQQWLADAGYPGGVGLPPITLWFNLGRYDYDYYQAIIDYWWTTLGVSVAISTLPWPEYLQYTDTGAAQVWRLGWFADHLDADNFLADSVYSNHGRFGGWTSAAYDNLVDQAAFEVDPAVRATLYQQAEEVLVETEAVMVPIYYSGNRVATRPYLDRTIPPVQHDLANWRVLTDTAIVDIGGGFLTSSDGRLAIEMPPGAVADPVELTLFPISRTPPPDALVKVGQAYGLHAFTLGGAPAELLPTTSYLMHVDYSDEEVVGLDEGSLALYAWDGTQWQREASSVDMGTNTVSAAVDHFSLFALMAGPDPLPVRLDAHMQGAPNVPDPALASDLSTADLVEQLFLGLFDEDDETGTIVPELATSWDISADQTVYTFTLRADVTWTDGNPVTAEDVRYSILRSLNPGTGAPYASMLFFIDNGQNYHEEIITDPALVGVEALNPATLVITLESPTANIFSRLSMAIARPVPQWAIEAYGEAWTEPGNIVSNGPFRYAETLPDDRIILEKNPTFYDAAHVQIETIHLRQGGDDTDVLDQYLGDRLDTAVFPGGVPGPAPAEEIHATDQACTNYYGFSLTQPPFDDPLVRKAFASATDRQSLVDDLGLNDQPALTFSPPRVFGHVDGYAEGIGLPYDPGQAQSWLADAGYPDGAGLPPITLWFNESAGHERTANYVRDGWYATLGVSVTLQSLPWEEYLAFVNTGSAQVSRLGWCADYLDAHDFLGDGLAQRDRFGGWSNTAYESLIDMGLTEVDPAVRQDLYLQAEEILVEADAVMIPIHYYVDDIAAKPSLDRTYAAGRTDMASWRTSKVRTTIGANGGVLSSFDHTVTLTVPAGTFSDTVILSHRAATAESPASPLHVVGQPFALQAIYGATGKPAEFLPAQSYDLVIQYSDDELGDVDEDLLALYYWHDDQWMPEPSAVVDQLNNLVSASPDHFSVWAIMGAPAELPIRLDYAMPLADFSPVSPDTFDPIHAGDPTSGEVVEQLFIGLVDVDDETGQVVPELATSWTISVDAMIYTFTLRSDVNWNDGNPVTAGDARYGILRALDPASGAGGAHPLFIIENAQAYNEGSIVDPNLVGVDVLDATTIRFTLEEPAAYLPAVLSLPVARPVPQWTIDAHGSAWTEPQYLVNSGPYRLVESVYGHHLLLEKNPDYFDAASVQIEQVYWWMLPDAMEAWGMYLDSDLDTGPIPEAVVPDPEVSQEVFNRPRSCTYYYGYINNKYPFDDSRVRQAFTQAIDRQWLVDELLDSRVTTATTYAAPGAFGALAPGAAGLTHDPAAAQLALNAFLTDEGMTLAEFNSLGITMLHNTSDQHNAIATAAAQMWQDVLGVSVSVEDMAWSQYLTLLGHDTPLAEMPHIFRMGWCHDYPDANNWLPPTFKADADSSNAVRRACSDDNCTAFTPTLFDEKLDQATAELDLAARETLYAEAEEILVEDEVACAPLYHYGDNVVSRPYLTRTFGSNFSDISDWSTRKVRQAMDGAGGSLTSYSGDVVITMPEGVFDDLVILTQAPATGMPPASGQVRIGEAFFLEAAYGASGLPAALHGDYSLVVTYEEGALGDVEETLLGLYYWDGGQWLPENSSVVDPDTNTISATPDHFSRWAIMAGSGLLSGSVSMQSRSDHSGAQACAWAIGEQIACDTTDAAGAYELALAGGIYTITLEMERFLDAEKPGLVLSGGEIRSLSEVTLLGGDANDSDLVNILDLSLMGARYGLSCGDPGWDDRADINDDCTVNILDLSVSGGNYQQSSPVPWYTWDYITIPDLPDNAIAGHLWPVAPDSLYVWVEVSHTDPLTRRADLYHWDGASWSQELSYPGYGQGRIHGNGPDDIFVSASCTGDGCTGFETPHLAHFDGLTWNEQTPPPETGSYIRSISGAPGEVQAATYGPGNDIIIRYDDSSEQWSHLFTTPANTKALTFLSAAEAYYTTCWGHGRWDGGAWEYKGEFDFCDISDIWGTRDGAGDLHLYTVGNNNFSNGIRVWKYTENANPTLLGTFGSKCGFVFGDPDDGSYICNGVQAIGTASGVWGSAADDVYVIGRLGPGADTGSGRIYRYDGASWQRLTEFGDIPGVQDVRGTGSHDVWFSLQTGRLLHYGS